MISVKIHMLYVALLVIGGLNWGSVGLFNYNFVEGLNKMTINSTLLVRTIYVIVGISALLLMFDRNFYLPFLGKTVMPTSIKEYKQDNTNMSIELEIPENMAHDVVKIQYWAANSSDKIVNDPYTAYGDYQNAGVANVVNGKATLNLNCPTNYKVNKFGIMDTVLPKHVHYRYINKNGMTSELMTKTLNC